MQNRVSRCRRPGARCCSGRRARSIRKTTTRRTGMQVRPALLPSRPEDMLILLSSSTARGGRRRVGSASRENIPDFCANHCTCSSTRSAIITRAAARNFDSLLRLSTATSRCIPLAAIHSYRHSDALSVLAAPSLAHSFARPPKLRIPHSELLPRASAAQLHFPSTI